MPHTTLSAVVATARRSAGASAPVATDGELLARFVATRDEPAFAELVRRLGPMVLGVCRRVAGDSHLADDAFQAAFVVLARRAADVRPREAVRGWVYGVAVRVAREARAVSARRRAREVPVPVLPDRAAEPAEPPDADALRILDEEIAGLPDHLRAAVVLCELDGLARKDAARRLGVPDGTLSSRLAKARKLLAARLRSRGIALSAAGLSAALGSHATARVPAALTARALASAMSPGVVPAAVAALSTGVLRIMFAQKLKAVLALATVALGALACATLAGGQPTPPPTPAKPPALASVPSTGAPAPFVPKPEITAPLAYKDLMLVLVTKDGAAAVVFADATETSVDYKYRYESADAKTKKTGTGKLFEKRIEQGGFDEEGLHIVAGPVTVKWSRSSDTRGWIYYIPEAVAVHMANAENFEESVLEIPGKKNIIHKKLDLQRFIRR